jgi:hypothetical protein
MSGVAEAVNRGGHRIIERVHRVKRRKLISIDEVRKFLQLDQRFPLQGSHKMSLIDLCKSTIDVA